MIWKKQKGDKYMDFARELKKKRWCMNVGGAHGVMVIVVGNLHGDTSSNPGRDWLHFT